MERTRDSRGGGNPRKPYRGGGGQSGGRRGGSGGRKRNQGYQSNSEIDQRIRQLESDGDPLSLAEQIAREYDFDAERSSENSAGDQLDRANITRLQQMNMDELVEAAAA